MFTLTRDEVRKLDARAVEDHGVPSVVLMENAGRGCAELLMALNPDKRPVVVLCGPGNNGGDGFVIARHLDNRGWPVTAWLIRPDAPRSFGFGQAAAATDRRLSADCEIMSDIWSASHKLFTNDATGDGWKEALVAEVTACGWVVDALFGTGLTRPMESPYHELVPFLNASGKAVLAVDLPSGLDCDAGEPRGPTVRATHTATFVAHKRGFLNAASRAWTGEIHTIDIGAPRQLVEDVRKRTS
jgi:NAD(P)H-hydrate epimerase